MYMSLDDLRTKFASDQAFAVQFVRDAADVGIDVDILDESQAQVDANFDSNGKLISGKLLDDINLLNTYVRVVKKITETDNAAGKARLYDYIHAPFDEPDFTIDTNTRVITVPSEFNKNGVGVLGDHLAEILFFNMPRFYDVVDLLESTNINIFWYNAGLKGETKFYKTTPVVKYAVGDVLYLGWAISQEATAAAGNIEFFFEFEHVNESGLVDFRLETQTAKVAVKNTLTLDKDAAERESYNDVIYSRAIYSPIINSLTAAPARITLNLPEGDIDFDNDEDEDDYSTILTVNAVSPDGGRLVFNWNWNSIMIDQPNANVVNDTTLPNVITYELANNKAITFSDPVELTYAVATISEGVNPAAEGWYKLVDEEYVLAEEEEVADGVTYYVASPADGTTYRTLKTNVPGVYQCFIGNENAQGGIRYVYSAIVNVEPAHEIVVNSRTLPGLAYLDTDASIMSISVDDANGALTYQWYHKDFLTGVVTPIEGATEATYDPSQGNTNTANGRGVYYCVATNTKNNTVKRATSAEVKIEAAPVELRRDQIVIARDASDKNLFHVTIANMPYEDAEYQMFAQVAAQVPNENQGYDTKIYPVAASQQFISNGTADFSIANVNQMYDGQKFDLYVYVVQISQRGTTYQRYATRTENGVTTPAYNFNQLQNLEKE